MKVSHTGLLVYTFLAALPLEFRPTSADSAGTNLKLAAGGGRYALVSRSCEGDIISKERRRFTELSGQIDHKFAFPVRVGVRGGYLAFDRSRFDPGPNNSVIINPFINLEGRDLGIGAGFFSLSNPLARSELASLDPKISFFFRLGDPRLIHFSVSFLNETPVLVEGFGQLGFGFPTSKKTRVWLGGNLGPYDQLGFVTKIDVDLSSRTYLHVRGRIGRSAGILESGLGVGLSYRLKSK